MALITTRTKLTRLLSYGSRSSGGIRVGSLGKFGAMCWSTAVAPVESGPEGFGMMGLKDYEDYRRSLYGEITHKALLVDAAGTLLVPSQPMAQGLSLYLLEYWASGWLFAFLDFWIYRTIGEKYGVRYSEGEILNRYRKAYDQPWGRSRLRYVNDGRPFWQYIVSCSTGCSDSQYFEELYDYYTTDKAWHLCDPDAEKVFKALRKAGVKLGVVSNFDTRLRPLMRALNCDHWFDAVAVSAEVEAEKPNPTIFLKACDLLGVKPEDAVHVGDDRRNDIWGARAAGCDAWLWGSDVHSFEEVAQSIGVQV
ncbi:N-acylneuraminate-9-phosphatase [Morella rubra]|uniref:N-acylneuraminate-9-phosphatase n=1 Tax=Morella rubra TaxID=262757 RepID=A0A6A1WES5_9ROSI|nr:N-acylneuraminate-9-phosphatase [Morella rubra]